jgi:23S rRNA G2069 N7-methylase RlmK/C1962 C5-methylase RlmI
LLGEQILDLPPVRGVVLKVRPGGACRPGPVEEEILGASPPRQLVVEESGVSYEVHPVGSLNVGLFTDLREHRRRLARSVADRRVLNLFAYTGSLSVVAGRHGATSVTSVDLSPGVLRWARKNFQLSGMDPDAPRFRFESADAPRFVRQALARADEYDLVILDPPAVSAARPSSWSLKNDYADLISQAAGLLPAAGGELWVTSNARGDRPVMRHIEAGMRASGRSFTVIESGGLPPDYPVPTGYPAGRYLEVFQLAIA